MKTTIELDSKQMILLAKMIHVADWIMTQDEGDEDEDSEIGSLISVLNKSFYESGLKELVEYDEELKDWFLSEEYEEEIVEIVEDYDEETFWSSLAEKLAERDLEDGGIQLDKMDEDERYEKLEEAAEKYYDEFDEKGIDRLFIKE